MTGKTSNALPRLAMPGARIFTSGQDASSVQGNSNRVSTASGAFSKCSMNSIPSFLPTPSTPSTHETPCFTSSPPTSSSTMPCSVPAPALRTETVISYMLTPPATPTADLDAPLFLDNVRQVPRLPNEILDQIFSFTPHNQLPAVMRTSHQFHALAERRLYHTLHLQLLPAEHPHQGGWQCLKTVVSRSSLALVVKHFRARGLPWIDQAHVELLGRAMGLMSQLVSFDLEIDGELERSLFSGHPTVGLGLSLTALNVYMPETARLACQQYNLPIQIARIAAPLDAMTARDVIPALGSSKGPLRQLQLVIQVEDVTEAYEVIGLIAQHVAHLCTLGIDIRFPKPLCPENFEPIMQRIGGILSTLPALACLSLAVQCRKPRPELKDVVTLAARSLSLERIELQWSTWLVSCSTDKPWRMDASAPMHAYLRRGFHYAAHDV